MRLDTEWLLDTLKAMRAGDDLIYVNDLRRATPSIIRGLDRDDKQTEVPSTSLGEVRPARPDAMSS